MRFVSEQTGSFVTQFQNPNDNFAVIEFSVRGTGDVFPLQRFSQFTIFAVLHEREKTRRIESDSPRPLLRRSLLCIDGNVRVLSTSCVVRLCCQLQQAGGQTVNVVFVCQDE